MGWGRLCYGCEPVWPYACVEGCVADERLAGRGAGLPGRCASRAWGQLGQQQMTDVRGWTCSGSEEAARSRGQRVDFAGVVVGEYLWRGRAAARAHRDWVKDEHDEIDAMQIHGG